VAFVLTEGNRKDIRMYVIGDKVAIDKQIHDFQSLVLNEMYSQSHSISSDIGDPTAEVMQKRINAGILLRKVLYDPLLDCLGERRQIFIVPDGELAQLPFEILSTDSGGHLIDRYLISYLSSSRDILRFGSVQNYSLSNPIVIADPDFDYGKETCLSENNYGMPANINLELEMDLYNIEFSRLEGSRLEGIEIANLLNVEPWLAGNALKSKVQSISSPFILHIASYGYYINDFQIRTTSDNLLNQVHTQIGLSNPFLRTGIALAGANWKSKNFYPSTEAGNGILTAEEFSGLALNGTELVILSACKTGLGDTPRGEGVLGFRQAVDMAGAKTLVMSLWNIPDKQTKQLMLMLYKRLSLGEGKAEALRNSQLALKEKYRAPYFWGGFICQGEVAPILHNLPTPLRDNISEE
jgi:CHAT domain-containing protein